MDDVTRARVLALLRAWAGRRVNPTLLRELRQALGLGTEGFTV